MKRIVFSIITIMALLSLFTGSVQAQQVDPEEVEVSNVKLPSGYFLVPLAMELNFPTALATSDDMVWVSEAGAFHGFLATVKQIDLDGNVSTLLSADQLPAGTFEGHLTDVTYHDGWLVGADNWSITGWLQRASSFHDFASKNIRLNGESFQTMAPFPLDPDASEITVPFMSFGSGPVAPRTMIHVATPKTPQEEITAGNATVYSFNPTAQDPTSTLRLEGRGFRNPYGLGIDPFHPRKLFASNNGTDYRSMEVDGELKVIEARPIGRDADDMFVGDIFIAETGSLPPVTGAEELTGFSVVQIDRDHRKTRDFIVHTAQEPEVIFDPDGFNKPIDAKFFSNVMLIADFGVFEPGFNLLQPGTGKEWVVCRGESACMKVTNQNSPGDH